MVCFIANISTANSKGNKMQAGAKKYLTNFDPSQKRQNKSIGAINSNGIR